MTYVLLIYRSTPPTDSDPAADREALGRHRALQEEARGERDLLAVAQLAPPHTARMVRAPGGAADAHAVTDGPYLEAREWLVGFYLVHCDDEDEALARARVLADDRHTIEVRPAAWRWAR
jgi:hypothetical protein